MRASSDPFPEDAITVHDAAELVKVSAKTISRRIHRGQLRHWRDRISGRIRLSRADVMQLWQARVPAGRQGPRPSPARREAEKREATEWCREHLGI